MKNRIAKLIDRPSSIFTLATLLALAIVNFFASLPNTLGVFIFSVLLVCVAVATGMMIAFEILYKGRN
jgi:hypothetical protein